MKRLPPAGLLAACLLASGLLAAAPPRAASLPRWRALTADAFVLLYPEGRGSEALEALGVLEGHRGYVQSLVGGETRRVTVVLQDLGIESNGLTDPAFRRILLFPTAPGQGDLSFHESWWRLVGVHEYTHWQHLSARSGLPALLVAAAGTWAAPGNSTPAWLKEGICVYAESGLSPLEGRLNEGTYRAILAALAAEGRLPSLAQATFQPLAFPGAGVSVRMLGGSFVSYLARTYGAEALRGFFEHFASSGWSYLSPLLPWAGLDRSARRAFGKDVAELWVDWQWDLIGSQPSAAARALPGRGRGGRERAAAPAGWSAGPVVAWQGALYYQRVRPQKPAAFEVGFRHELVRYDPAGGRHEVLVRSTAPFHGPMRVREGFLYFAVQELRPGYANKEFGSYGYEARLCRLDLQRPRAAPRTLLLGAFRSFEALPGGGLLLSRDRAGAFGSEIQLLAPGQRRPRPLTELPWRVEELLHDGSRWLYVSARRSGENPGLHRVRLSEEQVRALAAGRVPELRPETLVDTAYAERSLSLGPEGVLFAANWGGEHGLFAWDAGSGALQRIPTGGEFAAAPVWLGPDSADVYFTTLGADGYDLRRAGTVREPAAPPPSPALPAFSPPAPAVPPPAASPGATGLPATESRAGWLVNLGSLAPRALVPLLGFDLAGRDWQAGALLAGRSALGDVLYSAALYYDSSAGGPEFSAQLQTGLLPPLGFTLSYATAGEDRLEAALEAPLYRSLGPGLSRLALGLAGTIFEDDYSRRSLEPRLRIGLRAPAAAWELLLGLPVESTVLGSSLDDLALRGAAAWEQRLLGARLQVLAAGLHDFSGLAWRLPASRGYGDPLQATTGGFLSAELSVPILRIRQGLWNPAVFLEDLFLVPFGDLAAARGGELQWSAGAALCLELKAGARDQGVPLALSVGYAVTGEGTGGVLLNLESPLQGSGYVRGLDALLPPAAEAAGAGR